MASASTLIKYRVCRERKRHSSEEADLALLATPNSKYYIGVVYYTDCWHLAWKEEFVYDALSPVSI